jgi:nucleoid DNA-binding protein
LSERVQRALSLPTKKEAEHVVNTVIVSLETTLLNNLGTDGFTLKLNSFGKFSVRHRPGIVRKLGFSGETIRTKMLRKIKFVSLGALRVRTVQFWKWSATLADFEPHSPAPYMPRVVSPKTAH